MVLQVLHQFSVTGSYRMCIVFVLGSQVARNNRLSATHPSKNRILVSFSALDVSESGGCCPGAPADGCVQTL